MYVDESADVSALVLTNSWYYRMSVKFNMLHTPNPNSVGRNGQKKGSRILFVPKLIFLHFWDPWGPGSPRMAGLEFSRPWITS